MTDTMTVTHDDVVFWPERDAIATGNYDYIKAYYPRPTRKAWEDVRDQLMPGVIEAYADYRATRGNELSITVHGSKLGYWRSAHAMRLAILNWLGSSSAKWAAEAREYVHSAR